MEHFHFGAKYFSGIALTWHITLNSHIRANVMRDALKAPNGIRIKAKDVGMQLMI